MNKPTILAVAALLLVGAASASPPKPRSDFGSDWLGFEPNPPAAEFDAPALDTAVLGQILTVAMTALQAGDTASFPLGATTLKYQVLDDKSSVLTLSRTDQIRQLTLPPTTSSNVDATLLITAATVAVNRAFADNEGAFGHVGTFSKMADATLNVWGLVESFGSLAKDAPATNPGGVVVPPGASMVFTRQNLAPAPVDFLPEIALVDPDNNVVFDTLASHSAQVPTTNTLYSTASSIETALGAISVADLDLDSVLAALSASTRQLGVVDLPNIGDDLIAATWKLRVVDLPIDEPALLVDTNAKELIAVDGAIGKVSMMTTPSGILLDDNLLTALKDPDGVESTLFAVVKGQTIGKAIFDYRLGNYEGLVGKTIEQLKRGLNVQFVPKLADCKSTTEAGLGAQPTAPLFCYTPGVATISPKTAASMATLVSKRNVGSLQPTLKPDMLVYGLDKGQLPALPDTRGLDQAPMILAPNVLKPGLLEAKKLNLPKGGLGRTPDVDQLGVGAAPDKLCTKSCPGVNANILDGIYEGFQAPAMPGVWSVVPMADATALAGMATDRAHNGLAMVPMSALDALPIGTLSELTFRFVGAETSPFSGAGIPGVEMDFTTTDPFGLSTTQQSYTSNENGYVVAAVPSMGKWTLHAEREGYEPVDGAGGAPLVASPQGQEYTMDSKSGNQVQDWAQDNAGGLGLGLLVAAALVFFLVTRRRKGDRKRGAR